jgi:uncharacterized protein
MAYSTPGVYVVEKSLFPPSVAQVETAIPAFIGYTEKAMDKKADDLLFAGKRISSLKEYEKFFGFGPDVTVNSINLGNDNNVSTTDIKQSFILYDSLKVFFDNGGGDCYIICVGTYKTIGSAFNKNHFTKGLDVLKRIDEPTIILFPDATNLTLGTGYYDVQKKALQQCGELMDRVAVLDVLNKLDPNLNDLDNKGNFDAGNQELRDNIGMNDLKYGAAYAPWVNASIVKDLTYKDIKTKLFKNGINVTLKSLASSLSPADQAIINPVIDAYDQLIDDDDEIVLQAAAHFGANKNIKEEYVKLVDDFKTKATTLPLVPAAILAAFIKVIDHTFMLACMVDDLSSVPPIVVSPLIVSPNLRNDIANIAIGMAPNLETLTVINKTMNTGAGNFVLESGNPYPRQLNMAAPFTIPNNIAPRNWQTLEMWNALNTALPADPGKFIIPSPAGNDANRVTNMLHIEKEISSIFDSFYAGYNNILKTIDNYLDSQEMQLIQAYPVYKNIITTVNNSPTKLPPSAAIAGKYAYVDNTRGVWKAPANVSLDSVKSVCYQVEDKEQEKLNIDVNSGKSINIIRYFTGKGNLIWGARTLAGNDNEWRYVPVRRFFNMVEESCKKSTAWAVFEPNDAGTWIKVKGMIENFLILQWRAGALQGAKPGDAFYVKVGLGETMTSLDILEGRMNVEIGMAVVRPAEFIILTFSHKLAVES